MQYISTVTLLLTTVIGLDTFIDVEAKKHHANLLPGIITSATIFPSRKNHNSKKSPSSVETAVADSVPTSAKAAAIDMGLLSGYVTHLFNDADTNHDGSISPSEVYELVLKFYIKVNRQAPVPVPSRARVMELFRRADTSKTGRLDIGEFRRLVRTLYARVSTRILALKVVKMFFAPACAVALTGYLKGQDWLTVPKQHLPTFLEPLLSNEAVWSSVLTLLFVIGLSDLALKTIDLMWWGKGTLNYEGVDDLIPKD